MKAILRDMRNMRHIEAYTVAAAGFVIAIVSLLGDAVGDELKWSTLFTGLGVMVYRTTLPRHEVGEDPAPPPVVLHIDATIRVVVIRSPADRRGPADVITLASRR